MYARKQLFPHTTSHRMVEIDENEHVVEVIWDHWFVLVGKLITIVLAVLFPVFAIFVFGFIPIDKIFVVEGSSFALKTYFVTLWLIVVWMLAWNVWTNYFLNVLIVTDIRLFDITQSGFFRRQSASFRIDHIQNITVEQKGIISTMLNFGTIRFETAGENINFVAKYIPSPYALKKLIDEMQDGELGKSKEVHLHPDTIERIAPIGTPGMATDATESQVPGVLHGNDRKVGTFINDGL